MSFIVHLEILICHFNSASFWRKGRRASPVDPVELSIQKLSKPNKIYQLLRPPCGSAHTFYVTTSDFSIQDLRFHLRKIKFKGYTQRIGLEIEYQAKTVCFGSEVIIPACSICLLSLRPRPPAE